MRWEWRPPTRKAGKAPRIDGAEIIVGSLGEYACVQERGGIVSVVVWRGYDGIL